MIRVNCGVRDARIADTPFAVVDFETTGLRAGPDRVVEVAVVGLRPGEEPRVLLDTLINPCRPMGATEVHGITDDDVCDAPTFREVARDVARASAGAVVAAYNIYFDMPFLRYELMQAGLEKPLPHVCVMYLRPMLSLGGRCCLSDACRQHGLRHDSAHAAAGDALAAAELLRYCIRAAEGAGIATFGQLASLAGYKFLSSFNEDPISVDDAARLPTCGRRKCRSTSASAHTPSRSARAIYWDALCAVLVDLEVTEDEVATLESTRKRIDLHESEVRALHARAFCQAMPQTIEDRRLDNRECDQLSRLHICLRRLGWAPGDRCSSWPARDL